MLMLNPYLPPITGATILLIALPLSASDIHKSLQSPFANNHKTSTEHPLDKRIDDRVERIERIPRARSEQENLPPLPANTATSAAGTSVSGAKEGAARNELKSEGMETDDKLNEERGE